MADNDITKMKVADLKKELKLRGLPIGGNKTELTERLQAAIVDGDAVLDDSALNADDILEDDVLNDDELDEETKSLLDSTHDDTVLDPIHEDAVLKTPPDSVKSKSPDDVMPSETVTHKKIVLKRKQNIPMPDDSTEPDKEDEPSTKLTKTSIVKPVDQPTNSSAESNVDTSDALTTPDKKVVKLSELSAKERLEMRAKKFGAPVTVDLIKSARAERFGLNNPSTNTNVKTEASVELLKKRAERFGGSVSKIMTKIENLEKMQKRRERFGNAANKSSADYEEKARLRLEKFKQPVN